MNNTTKGYPWPASRLSSNEMALLADWREKTGLSICELLRQSVVEIGKIINGGQKNEINYKNKRGKEDQI